MKYLIVFFFIVGLKTLNAQISDFETFDFEKVDNIVKRNEGRSLNNLPVLVYKLTSNLSTDVEKFRAIYTWVCYNISGDSNQHNKVSSKQKKFKNDSLGYIAWNETYKKVAFKKLLKYKKTMCTGYAYLIKEMCFIANIECKIVDGYGRSFETNVEKLESLNHSWNSVKLNNKWYLCDATWSSGYMINGSLFVKHYNDGYFLTNPILFNKTHYPIEKRWFLNDSLMKASFIAEPIIYGETYEHKIIPITPKELKTIVKKNEEINFSFKTLKTISTDAVSLVKISGKNQNLCKIYNVKNMNGIISFKYRFKHKGFYDLHLKIGNDIITTYTFKVTKI